MRKKVLWIVAALALVAIPAVIGVVALRGDDSSSEARRAGALVAPGGPTPYQLQLTQAQAGAPQIKEAIVVDSFSFGVENPTTIGSATGGAGAGKIKFNELHITKGVDKASPLLFKQIATGAHYKTAILTLRKAGAKEPYATYTMEIAFMTKKEVSGASPEDATEEITFVFGKLTEQVVDPGAAPVKAGWDQVANVDHNIP